MNVRGYFEGQMMDRVVAAAAADASEFPRLRAAWREIKSIRNPRETRFRLRLRRLADAAAEGGGPVLVSGFDGSDPAPHAMDLVPWERWLLMDVEIAPELAGLSALDVAARLLSEMTFSGYSREEVASRRSKLQQAARRILGDAPAAPAGR
jgi:hypothetical protein